MSHVSGMARPKGRVQTRVPCVIGGHDMVHRRYNQNSVLRATVEVDVCSCCGYRSNVTVEGQE